LSEVDDDGESAEGVITGHFISGMGEDSDPVSLGAAGSGDSSACWDVAYCFGTRGEGAVRGTESSMSGSME
jgi:hypothetical protein